MENNLNNRVFNPNDHTTWRWENDEVLRNIPIEEAEARQIRQLVPSLGGTIYQVLNTNSSRFLYNFTDPNLNNNPQLLARRAAVIIKGQANNRVRIRGPVSNAHLQISNFFAGGNMVLPFHQATSIHKTIDSSFAVKEFYKGRKTLSTYEYCLNDTLVSLRIENIITKDCLFNFFNRIIANTESEDHNYINIRPNLLIGGAGNYIYEAYNYLREIYDYVETLDDIATTRKRRELLNQIISIEEGIVIIQFAIRVGLSSEGYGSILKYFARIKEELRLQDQIDNWTPLRIVEFINYVCEMGNRNVGLHIETINQLLLSQNFIDALRRAFEIQIAPQSLSYGLQVASTVPDEPLRASDEHKRNTFVLLAVALVSAPASHNVNADCVSNILDLQEGALALNLCRHFALNATILAQALHVVMNAENNPNPCNASENQIAYIELIANTVKEWVHIWLNPDAVFFTKYLKKQVAQVTTLAGFNVPQLVVTYVQNYLSSTDAAKLSFNRARVSDLNARSVACFMRAHRDNKLNYLTLCHNINFAIDIIRENVPTVDAALMNDFIDKGNGVPLTIDQANKIVVTLNAVREGRLRSNPEAVVEGRLNPHSVAQLLRVANSHKGRLLNLEWALKLMGRTFYIPPAYDPTAPHINHYLTIPEKPEMFNLQRKHNSSHSLLTLAADIRQPHAAINKLCKQNLKF